MHPFIFGKIPSHGDFIVRGLSRSQRQWWDQWCIAALVEAERCFGFAFDARYAETPIHRFHVQPHGTCADGQVGCIAASCDRVGRPFPLVLGLSGPSLDPRQGARLAGGIAALMEKTLASLVRLDWLYPELAAIATGETLAERPIPVPEVQAGQVDWIGPLTCAGER